jgi:aspartyl-tRNA synthetase
MVSGFDKYFQIVKCFRDEDLRANRQPEFTQIDIEMSFPTPDNFFPIIEGLTKKIFDAFFDEKVEIPFKRMCYKEAVGRFGIDRPDTRFGLELVNTTEICTASDFKVFKTAVEKKGIICGINLKGCGAKFSRKEIDDLSDVTAIYGAKGLAWMKVTESGLESNLVKFFSEEVQAKLKKKMAAEPGDLLVFVADKPKIVYDSLANLRLAMGKKLGLIDKNRRDFLWVVEFPLFEEDDKGNPTPMHHPFTSPVPEDIEKMDGNPLELRAQAYDLVLNGEEIAGGSIRIHQREVQKKIFDLIGITPEDAQTRFGFLLEAFKYGPPPHGGIAFGFDRLMMLINGTSSIRDVIAFPKTQRAQALMEECPTDVSDDQLKELGIKVR